MQLAQKFLETGKQFNSVIVFSSSSVVVKKQSANIAERQQIEHMLSLEEKLRSSAQKRNISLVIFRPTLVYGCGLDTNISRLAAWIRRFGFMPVNGKANGLRQPVHADDLAGAAVSALLSKKNLPLLLYLCGGQPLSYSDMVSRIFIAYRKSPRLLHLPQWLFLTLVNLAAIFGRGQGVNAEMVRRQRLDLVFDDRQARELLGYESRPFAPNEEDFSWEDTVNGIGAE
jgi:nucleoside-diphosphate-sugar epimerase